jgi:DNA-binding transcriptional ArsR family regulator
MSLAKAELIVHPVRLRILEAIRGRRLTAQQLAGRLPDVPQATLYRQIHRLVEGGILNVVQERRVNGIVEKTYAMPDGAAHFSREEFARITAEDHARYFAVFLGALTSTMKGYLAQERVDVVGEAMTYFEAVLFLTDEEARQFRIDLLELVNRAGQHGPGDGRRARTLGAAFIPNPISDPEEE